MIVGLGTDIVNVGRVERTCTRYAKRFMEMAKELGAIRSRIEGLIENKENRDEGLKSLLSEVDALRSLSGVTDYGI